MMIERELKDRTKKFAHDCVKFSLTLPESFLGKHVKGQLIRSATSVAANYRSACVAQTKNSFISKLSISVEECDESYFWI
jgi:four helix bundle protein